MTAKKRVGVAHNVREFSFSPAPGWIVEGRYSEDSTELAIEELHIYPDGEYERCPEPTCNARAKGPSGWPQAPAKGITADFLRESIPIGHIKAQIARERARLSVELQKIKSQTADPEALRAIAGLMPTAANVAAGRRAMRAGAMNDAFLRRVAKAWIVEAQRGPGAWERMLDRFADETSSINTIKGWIKKARSDKHQWLAPGPGSSQGRGQLIAEPGPRLLAYEAQMRAKRAAREDGRS